MPLKRLHREEGNCSDDGRIKKPPSFKRLVLDVMNIHRLQKFIVPALEPLIRRVVKEEVHSAVQKYVISMERNSIKEIQASESRSLKLQFLNSISQPVFTGTCIDGEGCSNIEVSLVDSSNGVVVSSSSKVEIVVLEGDFDGDDRGNWSEEEFKVNVVRAREGRKPVVTGNVVLTLRDGRGSITDVFFTDNSSWTRSGKFRLGAKLYDDNGGCRVREAISEPFAVRDHRGELYKKHYPPSLVDEVWRLEKIGKEGAVHRRLKKEGINTVQEFLIRLYMDPVELRNIFGTGMSTKMWNVTVDHARTCVIDKKLLIYSLSEANAIVFDVVGRVKGLHSNGIYIPADGFSESEKDIARQMIIRAFSDREKIITIDEEMSPSLRISVSESSLVSQKSSQPEAKVSSSIEYLSPLVSVGGVSTFEDCFLDVNTSSRTYDHHFSYPGESDFLLCDLKNMSRSFCGNEELYFDTDCLLPSPEMELSDDLATMNAFLPCSKGWSVLLSVLRWCFLIKRIARKGRVQDITRYLQC